MTLHPPNLPGPERRHTPPCSKGINVRNSRSREGENCRIPSRLAVFAGFQPRIKFGTLPNAVEAAGSNPDLAVNKGGRTNRRYETMALGQEVRRTITDAAGGRSQLPASSEEWNIDMVLAQTRTRRNRKAATKFVAVRIGPEVFKMLKELANAEGRSYKSQLERAINAHYKDYLSRKETP